MKFLAIIPARYGSSRFPGKPLAQLGGVEVINRVVNQVKKSGIEAVVATDDERIAKAVERGGGRFVMTRSDHKSGTDRLREAAENLHTDADVIINVQGDEPFIQPTQIEKLMSCFTENPDTKIATLVKPYKAEKGFEGIFDSNVVKVVFDSNMNAVYFSRSIIPYVRNVGWKEWLDVQQFYTHIGIYAYRKEVLSEITSLPQSTLEKAESLEQLRWIEAGYKIKVAISEADTIGIDTPADLEAAEKFLKEHPEF